MDWGRRSRACRSSNCGSVLRGGYYIDVKESFTFDCNAVYDETENAIRCTEQEISGKYSARDNIKLMSGDTELTSSDGNFRSTITAPIIPASEFETETYATTLALEKKYGETKEQFILFENGNQKLSKEVTIRWNITPDDKKLFDNKQDEWKKKQEAEKKAAEQKAAVESSATTTAPAAIPSTTSDGNNNTNNSTTYSSPSSGVDYVVEGYCVDGTFVKGDPSAKGGANKCYKHGGWRDY